MKIIIAPDSFKGTLTSAEVCDVVESAFKSVASEIKVIKLPVSDGGEGMTEAVITSSGGRRVYVNVTGPNFQTVEACYAISDDGSTAVMEMASASGLLLTEKGSTPDKTTTYGTGQLLLDALDRGCKHIILGVGGSATNDAGVGMAAALGVKFMDSFGNGIALTGGGLADLAAIDASGLNEKLKDVSVAVACDVDNVLYGPDGAAYIFAPQKGADAAMVERLDQNLMHFADVLFDFTGKRTDGIKGLGAAGGICASLLAFSNSELRRGIDIVLDYADFDNIIEDADYVITGEGRIDAQTLGGKVVGGVAARAARKSVPVIAIGGGVLCANDELLKFYGQGVLAVFSTAQIPESFEELKPKCREYLYRTAESIARLITYRKP